MVETTDPVIVPLSLATFAQELDNAQEWLELWRILVDRTRVRQYKTIFDGVLRARIARKIEEFAEKYPPEDYSSCFIDASAVQVIRKAFPKAKPRRLGGFLKRGLAGTYLLRDEKPETSKARDFLFELLFASYLRLRGLPVLLNLTNDSSRPDIVSRVEGFSVDIECKRTQSSANLISVVRNGIKQLERTDQRFPHSRYERRSLLVLDVSKHCFEGSRLFEFDTVKRYQAYVERSMGIPFFACTLSYFESST